jgi:hypothetical protein
MAAMTVDELRKALDGVDGSLQVMVRLSSLRTDEEGTDQILMGGANLACVDCHRLTEGVTFVVHADTQRGSRSDTPLTWT